MIVNQFLVEKKVTLDRNTIMVYNQTRPGERLESGNDEKNFRAVAVDMHDSQESPAYRFPRQGRRHSLQF